MLLGGFSGENVLVDARHRLRAATSEKTVRSFTIGFSR